MLSFLVYRNAYTAILNRLFPQLQKHMETIFDRYIHDYNFKNIEFFMAVIFSKMKEKKLKAKLDIFGMYLPQ